MKALILAGGFGTRLRPLSCTRPKLMFPIANRPVIDWTYGMKIKYSHEIKPLGTAGPLKNAKDLLDGKEPFFVLNGDIISEVDYNVIYDEHVKNGGDLTIALHKEEDPSRFGVAELDRKNRILRFIEKPGPEEEVSKLVNAGIYVVEPNVIDMIESGKKVSIEREIFPTLVNRGKLYGSEYEGVWVDIGTPDDYLAANKDLLDLKAGGKNRTGEDTEIDETAKIIHPTIIGSNVKIGDDSYIGPYTAIGDDVTIGRGARIEDSVVFRGAQIDNFSSIEGAIIGESAIIGRWARIMKKAIVADHAIISDNITLVEGVKVCHYKEVKESILAPSTIM
jgi:NDP-sugar pyrophosphorylase family protein